MCFHEVRANVYLQEIGLNSCSRCLKKLTLFIDVSCRLSSEKSRTGQKPPHGQLPDADRKPSGQPTRRAIRALRKSMVLPTTTLRTPSDSSRQPAPHHQAWRVPKWPFGAKGFQTSTLQPKSYYIGNRLDRRIVSFTDRSYLAIVPMNCLRPSASDSADHPKTWRRVPSIPSQHKANRGRWPTGRIDARIERDLLRESKFGQPAKPHWLPGK